MKHKNDKLTDVTKPQKFSTDIPALGLIRFVSLVAIFYSTIESNQQQRTKKEKFCDILKKLKIRKIEISKF
jgi:hypothetical protein